MKAACSTCGHVPAAFSVSLSIIDRTLLTIGSERGAISLAYRMFPDAPRDLVRAVVRWVRADEAASVRAGGAE